MGALIRQLTACCTNESVFQRPFRESPEPTRRLILRAKQLAKDNLLGENSSALMLMNTHHSMHTLVRSRPAHSFYVPAKKRTVEYRTVTAQTTLEWSILGSIPMAGTSISNLSVQILDDIWGPNSSHCGTSSLRSNEHQWNARSGQPQHHSKKDGRTAGKQWAYM
ncbi:hypothetical protein F441_15219, partial [Phytophthora nicotianae CJ01A1]